VISSVSLDTEYTYDQFLILVLLKGRTIQTQPEAMTKNAIKMIKVAAIPALFMTMSCNVVRKAESSVEVATVTTDNAADVQLRTNVIGWAQNYVGTKYRYASTNPKKGFDCSGFTSYIMSEYGIRISPGSSTQATQGRKVSLENAQPGDLVFFGRKKRISHVALIVSNNNGELTVVHSTNTRGVIVENINESDYWRKRVLFTRDVIGVSSNRKKNS
jgi:cell wall-associated NlpC family hydrolase